MTLPRIANHDEWREARVELLAEEKAMTKARDALSTKRRMLPMVRDREGLPYSKAPKGRRRCSTCSTVAAS